MKNILNRGGVIEIKGKYFSMNVTSLSDQIIDASTLIQYQSFANLVDNFFHTMKNDFLIDLLHKNKPHKKIIHIFDSLNDTNSPDDLSSRANCVAAKMENLRYGFDVLKKGRKSTYNAMRKNLIKNSNSDSYWGFVFELSIATLLTKADIEFEVCPTKDGSPDFSLLYKGEYFFIECHAISRNAGCITEEKFKSKVLSGVSKKEKKKYASGNCSLFIDVTSLESLRARGEVWTNEKILLDSSKFGNVTLFTNYMRKESGSVILSHGWDRSDYKHMPPKLKELMDILIPVKNKGVIQAVDAYLSV
jgi:hypothetical protein